MTNEQIIAMLQSEWEPETGFFWNIRQGLFRSEEFDRALKKVQTLGNYSDDTMSRRVVSLLWYVPIFMHWQAQRVEEQGCDMAAFTTAMSAMTAEVERVLGVP